MEFSVKKNLISWPLMNYLIFLSLSLFYRPAIYSQVKEITFKEIKVGDKIPDILLHAINDKKFENKRFSDLKGKLIILDFWSTHCLDCIAAFPKMEMLQEKYKGQVQVFIVNIMESQEEIEDHLRKLGLKNIRLPNLPSIVKSGAKELSQFFPHQAEPFHVWIDMSNIVKLKGSELNTHNDQKIEDVLAGKNISYLRTDIQYNENVPLYSLFHKKTSYLLKFNSFFSGFTDSAELWGKKIINKIDSFSGTIRNTYLNQDVIQLYIAAVNDEMKETWARNLNSTEGNNEGKVLLEVKDSLKYIWRFSIPHEKLTDQILRENSFCYEQITPMNLSETVRKKYMLEDLNRYFGMLYRIEVSVEQRNSFCYILIRASNKDKIGTKGGSMHNYISNENGRQIKMYINYPLKDVIKETLRRNVNSNIFRVSDILLDETGYNKMVDMKIPTLKDLSSYNDLRKVLQLYDLDIVKGERIFKVVVIKEK